LNAAASVREASGIDERLEAIGTGASASEASGALFKTVGGFAGELAVRFASSVDFF